MKAFAIIITVAWIGFFFMLTIGSILQLADPYDPSDGSDWFLSFLSAIMLIIGIIMLFRATKIKPKPRPFDIPPPSMQIPKPPMPNPPPISQNGIVSQGLGYHNRLAELRDRISDKTINAQITHLLTVSRQIFEFIDNAAELGEVYYYSLWRVGEEWYSNIAPFGNMRVDVNEVLGEPEPEVTEPEPHEEADPSSFFRENWIWITVLPVILLAVSAWFICRRVFKMHDKRGNF